MKFLSFRNKGVLFVTGSLLVLLFVLVAQTPEQQVKVPTRASGITIDRESAVEQLGTIFKTNERRTVKVTPIIIQGLSRDEVCVIEGETVKEGTVTNDTTCLNDTVSPTP